MTVSHKNQILLGLSIARTRNYFHQVGWSFVFKGLAVAASFVSIPITLHYLGEEQFGIWSTLLSIISWIVFFDLGIGNGLRNKLAESLAKDDHTEAAKYVSTSYLFIGAVSIFLYCLVSMASFYLPWQRIFNTHILQESELRLTVLIATFFIFLNFWLSLILQVLNAAQKAAAISFGQLCSNLFSLSIVVLLSHTTQASLPLLSFGYGIALITANIILSVWYFGGHRFLMPRLVFSKSHMKPLLNLGVQFFIIQLAVLVIYASDKVLISQLIGPSSVAQYEIVFKLFGVITLIYSLISAPLWSAYTDAFHRNDIVWIEQTVKTQLKIFVLVICAILLLVQLAHWIITLWIGPTFQVTHELVISMGFFVLIYAWNSIFSYVVNGVGEIFIPMICACMGMIINIPLAIWMTQNYQMGISGIIWASCISQLIFAVVGPFQVRSIIINNKHKTSAL